jgi:hypothetical protein
VMTGREALMPAAILHVVTFPIRYTTKKLIWTTIPVKRRNGLRFGALCQKDTRKDALFAASNTLLFTVFTYSRQKLEWIEARQSQNVAFSLFDEFYFGK